MRKSIFVRNAEIISTAAISTLTCASAALCQQTTVELADVQVVDANSVLVEAQDVSEGTCRTSFLTQAP
jgi:hypothetical protein